MQNRRVPLRTCTGCGRTRDKRELIRVVLTPQGQVLIDRTGKASGRGAYICGTPECLKKAMKTGRLPRALKAPVSAELYAELARQIEGGEVSDGKA